MLNLHELTPAVIHGRPLTRDEAKKLLTAELHELLYCADRIRRFHFGNRVKLCAIINAKSGACPQDCRFCAQSAHNAAAVEEYPLVDEARISAALDEAARMKTHCFGIVTSGRALDGDDVAAVAASLPGYAGRGVTVSGSFGILDDAALDRLKAAGMTKIHHNLETAESFFPNICSTHSYAERVGTVRRAKAKGFRVCSGGIFGLGESPEQRLELAFALKELDVDSIPLNFLNPIPGTPFEKNPPLSAPEILRTIALFRFILPNRHIEVCGGREVNLRDLQSWIFHAGASGMMVGGYLTTSGRKFEDDLRMLRDLGLEPVQD